MNEITQFQFQSNYLRVITDEKGNPWFVAKEVADILEYSDAFRMTEKLDDDEKSNREIRGLKNGAAYGPSSGGRGVICINEAGLYSVILTSKKPTAKAFKRWVTHEVLPAIRKTGSYSKQPEVPKTFSAALLLAAQVQERLEEAQLKIEQDKPLVDFATVMVNDTDTWFIREWAKMMKDTHNFEIGEKELQAWLIANGYVFRDQVNRRLNAYAKYEHGERGYFKMLAMDINNNERYVLKITGKGLKALTPLVMRLIVIGDPV